jgi:prepilin-type N-terminal cleavage/methylation domain-containing protein
MRRLRCFRSLQPTSATGGFTLIELLIAMMILGILMAYLVPKIPEAIEQAKITASRKNLMDIYQGLTTYQAKFQRLPSESGVKFFAVLISKGVWENTKASAKKLTCPGVDIGALAIGDLPPEEWFKDLDAVTGEYSAYAGRNCKEYPLRRIEGSECWIATDNDPEMNFRTTTLVLMGDGTTDSIEISDLQDQGILAADEEYLAVGPDSPYPMLQKLSLD